MTFPFLFSQQKNHRPEEYYEEEFQHDKTNEKRTGKEVEEEKTFFLKFNLVERKGFCFPRPRGVPPADHWLVRGGIIRVPRTGMPWNQLAE